MPVRDDASFVSFTISSDKAKGFDLTFERLRGTEELCRPFRFDVEASSKTAKADLVPLLGSSATLSITLPDKRKRYFNGIIARAAFDGLIGGAYHYRFELRPWIWLLSRTQDCRIFQKMSVWDIITKIFRDAGFSGRFSDERRTTEKSPVLEYCVQYNETSLDFVTRLMEMYGLYYYFKHTDGQHTLVMADDPNSHTALAEPLSYVYEQTEYRTVDAHVWGWGSELRLQPGATTFRDYNFETPMEDLTSKSIQQGGHEHDKLEVYTYPGPYAKTEEGQKLAAMRMQQFSAERQTLRGTSNARDLYAGCRFKLKDFPDASQNREYLVISANYVVESAEAVQDTEGEIADTFRCMFSAIPGDMPFRADRITPWPTMRGPQTALVVGGSSDEICTDKYGRIKVQFYWDRQGQSDENSSCWVRVAQSWTGMGWGSLFIPRVGQEVVVDFLDGNPDRPIVVGCVYNALNTAPYKLPDNMTRSVIKTNSSKGGGGFNELSFEDKAGSEEVLLRAQKNLNIVVLNNETVNVSQDQSITVDKGNRTLTLNQGNNSVSVNQGNDSLTVAKGNHSINVTAGSSTISAGRSITLKVGSNSITIDTTGVSINGVKIALSANTELSANGGGAMKLQAGVININ